MANRELGELSMDIGGDTYTMSLTIDAMVALEELFSTPDKPMFFGEIAALAERGSMKHIRGMIWAVFQEHHPDLRLKDIGKLVAKGGGLLRFNQQLAALAEVSKPDPKDLSSLGVRNPPAAQAERKASRGTGARSTSTHDASA